MIIDEIVLGENVDDKRKAIEDNLGKEVIVNDKHHLWKHGILIDENKDSEGNHSISGERYKLKLEKSNYLSLDYEDLEKLLIIDSPY